GHLQCRHLVAIHLDSRLWRRPRRFGGGSNLGTGSVNGQLSRAAWLVGCAYSSRARCLAMAGGTAFAVAAMRVGSRMVSFRLSVVFLGLLADRYLAIGLRASSGGIRDIGTCPAPERNTRRSGR